jgi:hypothetical protein
MRCTVSHASNDDRSTEVSALSALYQAERADISMLFTAGLALVGTELVFLVASVAFLDTLRQLPAPIVALVPIPLWLGLTYNIVIVALLVNRGKSVSLLEDQLYLRANLHRRDRGAIGARAGEHIMNLKWAPLPFRASLSVVYGTPFILVLGYTAALLIMYAGPATHPWVFWIALVVYTSMLTLMGSAILKAWATTPELKQY